MKDLCALWILLFSVVLAFGQSPDRHLASDDARPLYKTSAYAHGYIHGYEDGFHDADLDLQMSHGQRPLKDQKDYRDSGNGYRNDFGDKHYFSAGYKIGFEEGYSDSMSGRQFRAIDAMDKSAKGLDGTSVQMKERDFDSAFLRGYQAGHERGANGSLASTDFDYPAGLCQSRNPHDNADPSASCDAFSRGFSLGFGDGQVSRSAHDTQTARK